MQDNQNVTEADLSGLSWQDWRARLHDVAGDDGFAEPLGARHTAVFIEHKPVLLVTFESFESIRERSEAGRPLGWQMRDALGWSHLCLVCDGDTWFRDRHVFGFFDRLIDEGFFDNFEQVLFYGAGPCGYAAAAFSVASPGARVLALQPQATLDPRVAEWDDRFRHMRREDFTSRFGYAPDMLDAAEHAYIVYDPEEDLDAMHAALFTRSNVTKVRARFFGLELETMLLRLEVLYRMLAAACWSAARPGPFARRCARQKRPFERRPPATARRRRLPPTTAHSPRIPAEERHGPYGPSGRDCVKALA